MHALDQVQGLEFFQGAVHGDQAQGAVSPAGGIEDLQRSEGAVAIGDGLDDGAAGVGEPISFFAQPGQPGFLGCVHNRN